MKWKSTQKTNQGLKEQLHSKYKITMKRITILFFLIFIGETLAQENLKIGQINDPDGYTNIRKEANVKAQIVGKILKEEYFFYEEYNLTWYKVTKQNGVEGFVHKSRVLRAKEEELISLKISFEDNSVEDINETIRDTIIPINSLQSDLSFFIIGFNYSKIKQAERKCNSISFKDDSTYINFSIKSVDMKNYSTKKDSYGSVSIITKRGEEVYGFNGKTYPKKEINEINISINGEKAYNLPKSVYKYLFEPILESVKVYKKGLNQVIIYMSGADGSEGYEVIFIVNENGLVKRYVYQNF